MLRSLMCLLVVFARCVCLLRSLAYSLVFFTLIYYIRSFRNIRLLYPFVKLIYYVPLLDLISSGIKRGVNYSQLTVGEINEE